MSTEEAIRWIPASEQLPDSDITVLVHAPNADEPVWLGWHDGVFWFAVDGGEYADGDVFEWAEIPSGNPVCIECRKRRPVAAEDYCTKCRDEAAEAAWERSQGDCLRGGEAASALAAEQDRIRRELK